MALYFDDMLLEEIRQRNDIVDLISMYTDLKQSGNRFLGLCPFHKEKTPSFFVNKEDQLYYCFGCHEGGNIINFVEKVNNLDFIEAVKFLAERGGVNLPEENGEVSKEHQLKKDIYEINKASAIYFHNNLMNDKNALKYLTDRGLDIKTIKNFGLGYSKSTYTDLYEHLKLKGFSEWAMLKAGVISKKENGVYDFFRGRIVFPVIDLRGNVLAFSGRVMDDSLPKYLNTGETEAFKKRQNLFGLNLAKNSKKDYIILAEGQMDVIALHKYGFNNAVASLGTAFCEEHAKLIKRYAKKVVICYDNDTAGQNATNKAADYLISEGIFVNVAILKGGKDPDEILKKSGEEYFSNIIKNAPTYMEYLLNKEILNHDLNTMEGKISYARSATNHLTKVIDPLERELYIKRISRELDISEELIYGELKKISSFTKRNEEKKQEIKENIKRQKETSVDKINNNLDVCEGELINILINNITWFKRLRNHLGDNYFSFEIYNKIFSTLSSLMEERGGYDINMIVDRLSEKEKGKIIRFKMKELNYEVNEKNISELLKRIEYLKNQQNVANADSVEDLNAQLMKLRNKESMNNK
ncbi:MAG: DNA primase [Ruminococcaceae bacterium]|nr:DNA primase [Oscillospiraceae bacterium]